MWGMRHCDFSHKSILSLSELLRQNFSKPPKVGSSTYTRCTQITFPHRVSAGGYEVHVSSKWQVRRRIKHASYVRTIPTFEYFTQFPKSHVDKIPTHFFDHYLTLHTWDEHKKFINWKLMVSRHLSETHIKFLTYSSQFSQGIKTSVQRYNTEPRTRLKSMENDLTECSLFRNAWHAFSTPTKVFCQGSFCTALRIIKILDLILRNSLRHNHVFGNVLRGTNSVWLKLRSSCCCCFVPFMSQPVTVYRGCRFEEKFFSATTRVLDTFRSTDLFRKEPHFFSTRSCRTHSHYDIVSESRLTLSLAPLTKREQYDYFTSSVAALCRIVWCFGVYSWDVMPTKSNCLCNTSSVPSSWRSLAQDLHCPATKPRAVR